jgi:hypothetical protein
MSTGRQLLPLACVSRRQLARALGTAALAVLLTAAETPLAFAQSPTEAPAVAIDKVQQTAFRHAAIATITGNALDLATTVAGIQSGRMRELNPVLGQSSARIIVMKSLLTVPQILVEKHLADSGHPTAARWLGYTVGGFAAALAVRNVRVAR